MTKDSLIRFVKAHRWLYNLYYQSMSAFLNILCPFVKTDEKLILFVVFGGKFFSDSPRCIYEAMLRDRRFSGYRLVWAFRNPDDFPQVPDRVKIDSWRYFITALKARCWVTNESVTRALNFKGARTFFFFTTHTALPKIAGKDLKPGASFQSRRVPKYDASLAQSVAERDIQMRKYGLKADAIKVIGYPKNDRIANHTKEDELAIRVRLGIPEDRIILLYAPTFRDDFLYHSSTGGYVDLGHWSDVLGPKYFILYRAHHLMSPVIRKDCLNVRDVSDYSDNTDLLIVSDILVSDYSGIFFEFGVQSKPMFCYAYDYEQYVVRRGLYVDVREELPGGYLDEDSLLKVLSDPFSKEVVNKVKAFRDKWITTYGNATALSLDIIFQNIGKS